MTWNQTPEMEPRRAFISAKDRAFRRGIGWRLSFDEWWQLWREAWPRKASESLVLARYADWGPYERGNCRVIPRAENTAEGKRVTQIVNRIQFTSNMDKLCHVTYDET